MTPLWNLITAILLSLPFAPADVQAAGISVTMRPSLADRHETAIGWTWCGGPVCRIEVVEGLEPGEAARVLRHEVCHAIDWLADGADDGTISGWQPWANDPLAVEDDEGERLGYWCGRQEVRE